MASEAALENLNDSLSAFLRCGEFMTTADPRGYIRASNILFDHAIDAGMDRDTTDHVGWAAERVTQWLMSGPSDEEDA